MFGIGLPELIVILALALIVVGPEKLPELARSIAKGMVELKKTANSLRTSLEEGEDGKSWKQVPPGQSPGQRETRTAAAPPEQAAPQAEGRDNQQQPSENQAERLEKERAGEKREAGE